MNHFITLDFWTSKQIWFVQGGPPTIVFINGVWVTSISLEVQIIFMTPVTHVWNRPFFSGPKRCYNSTYRPGAPGDHPGPIHPRTERDDLLMLSMSAKKPDKHSRIYIYFWMNFDLSRLVFQVEFDTLVFTTTCGKYHQPWYLEYLLGSGDSRCVWNSFTSGFSLHQKPRNV